MADEANDARDGDRAARSSLCLLAGLAVLWTAFFAQQVLVPIVFAVLLKFLLSPVVRWCRRARVPVAVSSLVLVVGGLTAGTVAVVAIAPAASHWTQELPERLHSLEDKLLALRAPVEALTEATTKVGEKVDDLTAAAKSASEPATVVRLEQPTWMASALGAMRQLAVELFLMLAMLFLLLLGDGLVLSKVQAAGGPTAQRWVDALHAIERRMNLYVRSVCIVHGSIGVLFALFGWLWGMPSPWLWGTLVAVGNAIPFVGPLVVTGVLTIVALTSFDATGVAMVPPLVYVLLHVVENNVVTPCLLGRWLSLSPVAIFVMLTVMGFLWGVPGLVLAVPLLVVARISSDYVPAMQPLQLLLDGRAGVAPSAPAATPAAATIRPAMPVTEVSR